MCGTIHYHCLRFLILLNVFLVSISQKHVLYSSYKVLFCRSRQQLNVDKMIQKVYSFESKSLVARYYQVCQTSVITEIHLNRSLLDHIVSIENNLSIAD